MSIRERAPPTHTQPYIHRHNHTSTLFILNFFPVQVDFSHIMGISFVSASSTVFGFSRNPLGFVPNCTCHRPCLCDRTDYLSHQHGQLFGTRWYLGTFAWNLSHCFDLHKEAFLCYLHLMLTTFCEKLLPLYFPHNLCLFLKFPLQG